MSIRIGRWSVAALMALAAAGCGDESAPGAVITQGTVDATGAADAAADLGDVVILDAGASDVPPGTDVSADVQLIEDAEAPADGEAPIDATEGDDVGTPSDADVEQPADGDADAPPDDIDEPTDATPVLDVTSDASAPDVPLPDDVEAPADAGPSPDDVAGDASDPDAGPSCPPYHELCDGVCVNVVADPAHCGGCNVPCAGEAVCSGGQCADTCLGDLTPCEGTCVDTDTDADHCGGCNLPCGDGQGCSAGGCVASSPVGEPGACSDFSLSLPIGGVDTCLGEQAQVAFTWSVCSCGPLSFSNQVTTDAYDSLQGPYVPGGAGGGVGSNGAFSASNKLSIGGTLWAAGGAGVSTSNDATVAHELHSGGPWVASGITAVGTDAFVEGSVSGGGNTTVAGTLTHPPGTSVTGVTAGSVVTAPVEIADPCQCAPDQLIDVGAVASAYAAADANDNAAIGLDPNLLMNPTGPVHLTLPCGIYYLSGIQSSKAITIVATGRTALLIGGDVNTSGPLQLLPTSQAELDVLVAGGFEASNPISIGSPLYPVLTRLYLGTTGNISLSNKVDIGGYVYAAHAAIKLSNETEIFGGLVAGSLTASNKLKIHYDRAVLQAGQSCEDPPPSGSTPDDPDPPGSEDKPCESCQDCGNQACMEGLCGACESSADCCAPLVCVSGQCLTLGVIIP